MTDIYFFQNVDQTDWSVAQNYFKKHFQCRLINMTFNSVTTKLIVDVLYIRSTKEEFQVQPRVIVQPLYLFALCTSAANDVVREREYCKK